MQLPGTIAYTCNASALIKPQGLLEGLRAIKSHFNSSQGNKEAKMSFFCRLSRKHYWCIPHRTADKRLVQVCYECGAERPVHEFHDEFAAERLNQSLTSARTEIAKLSSARLEDSSMAQAKRERIAVGQGQSPKFQLVK